MDFSRLEQISSTELKDIAKRLGFKVKKDSKNIINDIIDGFKEYESYNKVENIDRYRRKEQLGDKGKEGTTYLVVTKECREYAMKTFRKQKSSSRLEKEAKLQELASSAGIAPEVIDVDTVSKYIVMEKLDKHLIESMKKQGGALNARQQKQIIKIFQKLDNVGVFHGDSNILNYMYKGNKLYIIDFGMSKSIDNALIKKLGTRTPNIDIGLLGMVLKLKELRCSHSSYEEFLKYIPESEKVRFQL